MESQLLWGVLDMLVLDVLSNGPSYGYQISMTVVSRSKSHFEIKEGSLYPALHRLERSKLLSSFWEESDAGRRRKYYKLTAKGRRVLESKRKAWLDFSEGVAGVLGVNYGVA